MDNGQTATNGATSPTSQKRQRAKQACEPCRLRKRRCDGEMPCNMCTKFDYKCYFEKHARKRSKIVEKDAQENGITGRYGPGRSPSDTAEPKHERAGPEELLKMRSMEANSGIAFTKLLGMRLNANAGPQRSQFGWNLGTRHQTIPVAAQITELISMDIMLAMAKLYFEKVHPLYGILDRERTMDQILTRYTKTEQMDDCPDAVFAGIAALGAIFSPGMIDDLQPMLLEAAKLAMEATSILQPPRFCDVQAWLLRVTYLRFFGHPHACWIASNTTMHLAECIGLHQERNSSVIYATTEGGQVEPDIRRRVFWVARLFNSWVSFEYGRSRVAIQGITCQLPDRRAGDNTRDYIDLYSISCCLDPILLDKPGQWEDFVQQIENFDAKHECISMSKANLALCGYRRLRLTNPNIQGDLINRIIALVLQGLHAAKSLAILKEPWWHVANVPFQSICVFLAIDSKESLSHIGTALRILDFVCTQFPSHPMDEASKTARFLVRLSKKKKEEDTAVLTQSLHREESEKPKRQPETHPPPVPLITQNQPLAYPEEAALTTSSGEDWNLEYLNDADFDWNALLSQTIPSFAHFAPDGMI